MDSAAANWQPVQIIGALGQGLKLAEGDRQWCVLWAAIKEVVVGRVPFGGATTVVACIGLGDRSVTAFESQPEWSELMKALHEALPSIEPYDVWSCRPEIGTRPYAIYRR